MGLKKQDINIRIIDVTGNVISNQQLTNVLNQTYPLDLSTQQSGIYIIQVTGDSFYDVMAALALYRPGISRALHRLIFEERDGFKG